MKLTYILAPALLLLAGCSHSYRADQTPAPSKVLYIDSQLADCVGVAPMKCMKVKKKNQMQNGNFSIKILMGLPTNRATCTGSRSK